MFGTRNKKSGFAALLVILGLAIVCGVGAQRMKTVTVNKGDTLWSLAKLHLGSGYQWREFLKVNTIPNPNKIAPGQVLNIPGTMADEVTVNVTPAPVRVDVPVSTIEIMLKDMQSRLGPLSQDLAGIRTRLDAIESKIGGIEADVESKGTPAPVDISSIERRIGALDSALKQLATSEEFQAAIKRMDKESDAAAEAQVKMLKAELETLTKTVETQNQNLQRGFQEFQQKLAATEEEEISPRKRRLAGLISTVAVGLGFLAVSATR